MKTQLYFISIILLILTSCTNGQNNSTTIKESTDSINKIEMNLSAFGVESDDFPSINVFIDFNNDSSHCVKTFYNPAYKGSTYSLTKNQMTEILKLLKISDIEKLKSAYKADKTDQPRSTTIIYTNKTKYSIDDYGLIGDSPLQELYKIVYRY